MSAGNPGGPPAIGGVSVVIPTWRRVDLVERLLNSLKEAGAALPVEHEIIVVDTSPAPDDAAIARLCAQHGARYTTGPWRVGAKRNVGARLARHELVVFVDSDCAATRDLLVEHLRAYADDDVVGVVGLTQMWGSQGLLWRILSRSREYNIPYSWPRFFSELGWGPTSNLSVRRSRFLQVGGFDESTWTLSGCEDVDMCVQLGRGGRIVGAPRAVVDHARAPITNVFQVVRKLIMHGQADVWLATKYPDRVEYRANPVVVVAAALLAAGGAAVVRRSARPLRWGLVAPLAVGAGTLLGRLDDLRGRDWYLEPLCLPVDWSFDLGVVIGAIRHRRPANLFRRFRYCDPRYFRLRQGDRVPRYVFSARSAVPDLDRVEQEW